MVNKAKLLLLSAFLLIFVIPVGAQTPASYSTIKKINPQISGTLLPVDVMPVEGKTPPAVMPSKDININGQQHSYTVTLRGNGDALVGVKILFSNIEESDLRELKLRFSKIKIDGITGFQVFKEPVCSQYRYEEYDVQTKQYRNISPPVCLEYREPGFYEYAYGPNTYRRAGISTDGEDITVALPEPVKPNGNGAVMLYYRASGYAKKGFAGRIDYVFETLKTNERISAMTIGISVDSDLYLRGVKGNVSYSNPGIGGLEMTIKSSGSVPSRVMDNYYQQFGQGQINKYANNLQPFDSYTVKGSYADSIIKLYSKEIALMLIAALAFLSLMIFLVRKIIGYWKRHRHSADISKNQTMVPAHNGSSMHCLIEAAGGGFLSAFLLFGYTIGLFVLDSLLKYNYSYGNFTSLLGALILVVSVPAYIMLLLGMPVFILIRRNWKWGLLSFAFTVAWMVIFIMVSFFILLLLSGIAVRPVPILNSIK